MNSADPPSDAEPGRAPSPATAGAAIAGGSKLESLAIWFAGSALATLAIAWLAFQIQGGGGAPEVLFPIGIGLMLGVALVAVQRKSGLNAKRWMAVATVGWGLLAVLGQEYCGYHYYCRHFAEAQNNPRVNALARAAAAQLEPATFSGFLQASIRRRDCWWWGFDVLATVLTAVIIVVCNSLARPMSATARGGPTSG